MNKLTMRLSWLFIMTSFSALNSADAQNRDAFGVRAGIYADGSDLFVGGEYLASLGSSFYLNPNVEFVLPDHASLFTFNMDVHYDIPARTSLYIWAGGGLGIVYFNPDGPGESSTDAALNILFGLGFPTSSRLIPYIQAKGIISDNSNFVLAFGLRF
ncbi:MAG TPA: hypothetical protein VMT35_05340 [Ignavibacteriaceae bacterium]|nr:hypothetical protein [Ignavibacteriaceae bacterium]